jgi:uncharacterized protein with GYD domain
MAKYVLLFSYTSDAWARMINSPGDWAAAARQLADTLGGTLESAYLMLGIHDGIVIADLPDSVSAAAMSIAVTSSGAFKHMETHELFTQQQLGQALEKAKPQPQENADSRAREAELRVRAEWAHSTGQAEDAVGALEQLAALLRTALEGADLHEQIRQMIDEVVAAYVDGATGDGLSEEWDLDRLWAALHKLCGSSITIADIIKTVGEDRASLSRELITEVVRRDAQKAYDHREAEISPEVMRELERRVVLSVLGMHLQKLDPQQEGYGLFASVKEETVGYLFNLKVEVQEYPIVDDAAGWAEP